MTLISVLNGSGIKTACLETDFHFHPRERTQSFDDFYRVLVTQDDCCLFWKPVTCGLPFSFTGLLNYKYT